MWECDVDGSGAGQQSPVPVRNRLYLGVCVQGTPEGGSACMGKLNSRRGLYIGLSVGRAAGWRGVGAGVGFGGKGKKSPALGQLFWKVDQNLKAGFISYQEV